MFVLTHSITVQRFARGFLARLKTEKPAVRAKRLAEAEAKRKEMEAEAEAERIKLQAERQRVEEESRKAEVDRLKRIEEEKMKGFRLVLNKIMMNSNSSSIF
jgi:regulator of protease activity HflC (stomatin/prohibitin superfamily)